MPVEPGKIRNVAVVGHRGTGKTSLVEALLFQAGATNRLGTVEAGSTVSDWDEDEQRRQMSFSASDQHVEWQGRKINLIDTPGDAGFQGDAIAALARRRRGAVRPERRHGRRGADDPALAPCRGRRSLACHLREHARPRACRLLPRPRGHARSALGQVRRRSLPIGSEHELTGIVDLLHMQAYMDPNGERESQADRDPGRHAGRGAGVPREASRLGRRDGRRH